MTFRNKCHVSIFILPLSTCQYKNVLATPLACEFIFVLAIFSYFDVGEKLEKNIFDIL